MNRERLVNKGIELSGAPKGPAAVAGVSGTGDGTSSAQLVAGSVINPQILAQAVDLVSRLGKALREMPKATNREERLELLSQMHGHLGELNSRLASASLHVLTAIGVALSKLCTTFTRDFETINLSSLRTSSFALDILSRALGNPDTKLLRNAVFRILVVDDHAVCRHTLSMALNSPYFKLSVCEDAPAALALMETGAYDAVFTDIMMPEMDGFAMVANVRKISLHLRTPVVFVTALSDFETRAKSVLNGGCDLIAKPFSASEVVIKALTIALKHRLDEATPSKAPEPAVRLSDENKTSQQAAQDLSVRGLLQTSPGSQFNGNGHQSNGRSLQPKSSQTFESASKAKLQALAEKLVLLEKQLVASQSALSARSPEVSRRPVGETLPELTEEGARATPATAQQCRLDSPGAAESSEMLLERERTERRLLERRCTRLQADIQHYLHQLAAHKTLESGFHQREEALKRQLDDEIEHSRQATQSFLAAQADANRLSAVKPACQAIYDKIQTSSAALTDACRDLSVLLNSLPGK